MPSPTSVGGKHIGFGYQGFIDSLAPGLDGAAGDRSASAAPRDGAADPCGRRLQDDKRAEVGEIPGGAVFGRAGDALRDARDVPDGCAHRRISSGSTSRRAVRGRRSERTFAL